MNKPIIIIGNGGHAAVLVEILVSQQRKIMGYTAPQEKKSFFNLPYLGTDDVIINYRSSEIELVLGLGTINISPLRKSIFEQFKKKGYLFASVIHSATIVSPSVQMGQGIQIMAGAIVQTNVVIGSNVIINTGSIIDHDGIIGSHAHIAPGSKISGGVSIGDGCLIGVGTSIIQGITIGNDSLVGAGSVVIKSIGNRKTAYGVPAKEV
ncbi:MAG: acetyltransferase [Psychrobacillus psychrotolerans]|uniref:acetyltransferase n=1 Tax=Psychrobacillus psychrotolerans TaxID=126156 RepID=UPI003BB216E7